MDLRHGMKIYLLKNSITMISLPMTVRMARMWPESLAQSITELAWLVYAPMLSYIHIRLWEVIVIFLQIKLRLHH